MWFHFKTSDQDVSHPRIWSRSMCSGIIFFNCPTTLPQKKWKIAPYCGWAVHKQLATNIQLKAQGFIILL